MSAHLDTVFPRGTNVKVRRQGYVLRGPGIGDDCRGLADLLAVARALNKAGVTTPGTITFVGTVGEEGLGDLRGVKRLFNETLKDRIDRFVSIDGEGLGITHIAIGSARFRVTFKGPGGHSFGSFGTVNPDSRAGPGDGAHRRLPGAELAAHDVQRRAHWRRHVDQRHRERGLDGSRSPLGRRAVAARAREAVPPGGAGRRGAGERALEQLRR